MLKLKNKYIVWALWGLAAILLVLLLLPNHPVEAKIPLQGVAATGEPDPNSTRNSLDFDNQGAIGPDMLALHLFGRPTEPVHVAANQTPAPSKSPPPLPINANIKFIGVISVEGVRKMVFSDTISKISFAISAGERYAGWTCKSIGDSDAIMSREGIEYRVPIQNQ